MLAAWRPVQQERSSAMSLEMFTCSLISVMDVVIVCLRAHLAWWVGTEIPAWLPSVPCVMTGRRMGSSLRARRLALLTRSLLGILMLSSCSWTGLLSIICRRTLNCHKITLFLDLSQV